MVPLVATALLQTSASSITFGRMMAESDPILEAAGIRVAQSPWGPDDQIGRLNLITGESRSSILSNADGGRVFDLSVEYFNGMPSFLSHEHLPKYAHWMLETPRTARNDAPPEERAIWERYSLAADAVSLPLHTGTHIDMLNHVGSCGCFWNGWHADEEIGTDGWQKGGSEFVPPIFARGVLLDIAGLHGVGCLPDSHPITPKELAAAASAARVELRRGDVVLVRTGRMQRWPDYHGYTENDPGVTLAAARYLADAGAMCVGSDTATLEVSPMEEPELLFPCHMYLFAEAGAMIIEVLNLEELSRERQYEFAFFGFPLRLRGSTAAPLRAIAMPLR